MGVDLGEIVPRDPVKLEDLRGWTIAIDAANTLYQFLSTIRQPDGTPLQDKTGRVTSHLAGLLHRTAYLVEVGIRPIYVFDGEPPALKGRTLEERRKRRAEAEVAYREALEEGDLERAFSKAQQSTRLTRTMCEEAQRLLGLLGIPFVQAPSEGEAQAAFLAKRGEAHAVSSQDYDSLLFGAPAVVRNVAVTGKRKLPGKRVWVEAGPELVVLDKVLQEVGITKEGLVGVGILVGTDYNEGIKGIGPKRALKLIKEHGGDLSFALRTLGVEIPNLEEIRKAFLDPPVTTDYTLRASDPDEEGVVEFLVHEYSFSEERVRSALQKFQVGRERSRQKSLDAFFS